MKKIIFVVAVFLMSLPGLGSAADFRGAPLMDQGRVTSESETEIQVAYQRPVAELVEYYRGIFQAQPGSVKFRDRGGESRFEDYEGRAWHKIVITEGPDNTAVVTVTKDSWTWIITMLVLRFMGVFVVLLVLFIAVSFSTKIVSLLLAKKA
ncbi:MAG: hypothetical protein V1816_23175 [Pseudomonadota bacterium]